MTCPRLTWPPLSRSWRRATRLCSSSPRPSAPATSRASATTGNAGAASIATTAATAPSGVRAIANEGGLRRDDFGAIQIRPDFSLVELPADLPRGTLDRLTDTRISGQLIELRLDTGGPGRSPRGERP